MLDDATHIIEIDKSHMLDKIAQFPSQIREAVELGKTIQIEKIFKIDNIIITGMGASGLAGDIIQRLYRDRVDVPILINREYDLPKWTKKDTLTIFMSYSGNTEETLAAFKHASQKKCKIISISSGGKLQDFSEKRGLPHIKIPSGFQPREAIGYFVIILLSIFHYTGLLKNSLDSDIEETIEILTDFIEKNNKSIPQEDNLSKQISSKIAGTIPQIYGWGIYSPISIRWRTQFNENSKIIACDSIVPESNHNDIVGWSMDPNTSKRFTCILFRDKSEESIYMTTRLDFMKNLFEETAANVIEIQPVGKSRLTKMMYSLCLGDFISCYLAVSRNIDPTPVDAIKELKSQLASR